MGNNNFNETEITRIVEAMAGKLVCDGVTTINFTHDRCKKVLSNCVLADKLIVFFEQHHLKVYNEIVKIHSS